MAVARDKPIKQGHLLVPPLLKKKWQKKYCVLYSFSTHGIERLEIYDSEDDVTKRSCSKLITLENCVKISLEPQKNQPYAFSIITKNDRHCFAGVNSDDSMDWVVALQGVAFRDSMSTTTIEEDNELYCPSGDAGVFRVVLVSTEASQRCGLLPGDYTLVVATEELQIRNPDTQNLLFTWPYRFIRRYGHKRGRFNFEAGRKCASGEGSFDLEHNNAQEIFKCMTSKMDSMKQRLGNNNLSQDKLSTVTNTMSTVTVTNTLRTTASNGSLSTFLSPGSPEIGLPMEDDEGLDAARTMSARSRSPLVSLSSPIIPIGVPPALAPMKPPRKNPPAPVPRYDQVEVRTDAWRTLGTDTVHTERHTPDRTVAPSDTRTLPATAVFIRPPPVHDFTHSDYDKLDHFGSTPKLDEDPSYSTIYRTDTAGYGVIRKPVRSPHHEVYNEFEYAMVVKPHQPSHKV